MLTAVSLSQYNFMHMFYWSLELFQTHFNLNISNILWVIALYSDFVLLHNTMFCFLLLQVTKLPHTYVQNPDVDLWLVIEPAQSISI